jgi:hypothetical protein
MLRLNWLNWTAPNMVSTLVAARAMRSSSYLHNEWEGNAAGGTYLSLIIDFAGEVQFGTW